MAQTTTSVKSNSKPYFKSHSTHKSTSKPKPIPQVALSTSSHAELQKFRATLPVWAARSALQAAFQKNPTVIIVSATGSGKTSQIPQFLYEWNHCRSNQIIACTQPRRVAAISVAQRVSAEQNCTLGSRVGYCIRFEDCTSQDTKLKYITDGMLLRETLLDPNLMNYSVIVLDECHERSLNTDVLFALLKQIQAKRSSTSTPLKLIAMSATLQAQQFSEYFNSAPVLQIEGRTFPVEVFFTHQPQPDYLEAALICILQIHTQPQQTAFLCEDGDILVFLTGQEEIEAMRRLLESKIAHFPSHVKNMLVRVLYAALPPEQQLIVFQPAPANTRKVILATNIAETSITLPNITYVIDTGVGKIRQFQAKTGFDSLIISKISKAEAWQRSGRAGREKSGVCYRLYTEQAFESLPEAIVPEILRSNLAAVVLQLKSLKIDNILSFDFMSKPPKLAIKSALEQLLALEALDSTGQLTELGSRMVEFPLSPAYAKCLIRSCSELFNCSSDVLSIIAMLCVDSIFYTPKSSSTDETRESDTITTHTGNHSKRKFAHYDGDHLTLFQVYQQYSKAKDKSDFCYSHFLNQRSMKQAEQIRGQLADICRRLKLPLNSAGQNYDVIRRCFTVGFFLNVARKQSDSSYRTLVDNQTVFIHPNSVLFTRKPDTVIYNELVLTTKRYMRDVTAIQLPWLTELVPNFWSGNAALNGETENGTTGQASRLHLTEKQTQLLGGDSRSQTQVNSSVTPSTQHTPVKSNNKQNTNDQKLISSSSKFAGNDSQSKSQHQSSQPSPAVIRKRKLAELKDPFSPSFTMRAK